MYNQKDNCVPETVTSCINKPHFYVSKNQCNENLLKQEVLAFLWESVERNIGTNPRNAKIHSLVSQQNVTLLIFQYLV